MITTKMIRNLVDSHNEEYPSEKVVFPDKLLSLMDSMPCPEEGQKIIDETYANLKITIRKMRRRFSIRSRAKIKG